MFSGVRVKALYSPLHDDVRRELHAQYRSIPPSTAQYRPIPLSTAPYRPVPPSTATTQLTWEASCRADPLLSFSVRGNQPCAPRPASPGCWRTAPSAAAGCPGCCRCRPLCSNHDNAVFNDVLIYCCMYEMTLDLCVDLADDARTYLLILRMTLL